MRAGKNTPESVLLYIDRIWEQNAPPDAVELAVELGYGPKAITGLQEKHGDGLLIHLEAVRRERAERPRFMARQQGRLHPQQYVSSRQGAIDDAEALGENDLKELNKQRKARAAERREMQHLEREKRSLEARLGIARKVAEARGVNISPHVRVIQERLERIEKMLFDERRLEDAA